MKKVRVNKDALKELIVEIVEDIIHGIGISILVYGSIALMLALS